MNSANNHLLTLAIICWLATGVTAFKASAQAAVFTSFSKDLQGPGHAFALGVKPFVQLGERGFILIAAGIPQATTIACSAGDIWP